MKGSNAEVCVLKDQVDSRFCGEWQRRDMEAKAIDFLQASTILESPWGDGFQGAGERERREIAASIESIGINIGYTFWHNGLNKGDAVLESALWYYLWMPDNSSKMGTLSEQQGA